MSYKQLSLVDRTALMLESNKPNFSVREFAQQIKHHHSTIYRELKRNNPLKAYNAENAISNYIARRKHGGGSGLKKLHLLKDKTGRGY